MSAFAQSTVTLTGNIDVAGSNSTGTQLITTGKTFSTTTGTSSTSVIKLTVVEDLGGGMKVTGLYGLDPRTLANDSYGVTLNTGATGAGANGKTLGNTATGLARDEFYVGLSGDFGNVRLGAANSIGLETTGASSPLGTATGSGYAPNSGVGMNSIVNTRYSRSIRFDSPTIAGFTASVQYAPGNDVATATPVAVTAGDSTALGIVNARKTTEIGLKYANGPLNVSIASIKQAEQTTNKTGWYSGALTQALAETSATVWAASYALPTNTTVYIGGNSGDRLASVASTVGAAVKSKGNRVAVKQTVGQWDLIAQHTTQTAAGIDAATGKYDQADVKAKITGATALYNLSKTAATYVAYEKFDTGMTYATAVAGATGDRKIVSIGLRKQF